MQEFLFWIACAVPLLTLIDAERKDKIVLYLFVLVISLSCFCGYIVSKPSVPNSVVVKDISVNYIE